MIINASGGNADAVMTVAQTLSDTQKTQARTNIGALSSASGAVAAKNLASNAVETAKIKDAAVTRAKLAQDVLYSPIVGGVGTRYITSADIGKTLKGDWDAAMTLTITQENSANIPEGAEFAVLRWGTSGGNDCKIIADGTRLVFTGDNTLHQNGIAKVSEAFGMIALKKVSSSPTQGDAWLVTGNVEVV